MAHAYDDDPQSADAIVHKANRQTKYIPYQDSPYYAEQYDWKSGPGYGDQRSRRGGDDHDVFFMHERERRRRYGGSGVRRDTGDSYNTTGRHSDDETARGRGRDRDDKQLDIRRSRPRRNYGDSRSRSRSGSRRRGRSRGRSTSRPPRYRKPSVPPQRDPYKPPERYTLLKAAKSAAMAGGVEALRCRKEPGSWSGQKGKRVALAAAVGVAIGALRNGQLLGAGQKPYAEAAMSGFYGLDFLKRVIRHTEFGKEAEREQRDWREQAAERDRREEDWYDAWGHDDEDRRSYRGRSLRY